MTIDTLPATLSIEQAGRLLGLSRSAAYRAAARGELPILRFGRRLLVPTGRLLSMLGFDHTAPSDASPATSADLPTAVDHITLPRTVA